MFAGFSPQPDARTYSVIQPKASTTERNSGNAPGADDSARLDFSDADRADDDALNAILWRAIKHTDPPAPVHSAFAK